MDASGSQRPDRNARAILLLLLLCLGACGGVQVREVVPASQVIAAQNRAALRDVSFDATHCRREAATCIERVRASADLASTLRAELVAGLLLDQARRREPRRGSRQSADAALTLYAAAARESYLALREYDGAGDPAGLRRSYNLATERFATLLFARLHAQPATEASVRIGAWRVLGADGLDLRRIGTPDAPQELQPAARLRVRGLDRLHREDGVGAAFVAIGRAATSGEFAPRFRAVTVLLRFASTPPRAAPQSEALELEVVDPFARQAVRIGAREWPITADFSASYALWLSRSHFARAGGRALLRGTDAADAPQVHLLQPYDPQRRVVVLLHGLGSSPEAWIPMANALLGDATLRRHYQVWQVFYPTALPIAESRHRIREALQATFATFDPRAQHAASRDAILIGHSMGGVISRLLLLDAEDALWRGLFERAPDRSARRRLAALEPYLTLRPLPQASRAIYLASPHRGTPLARGWLGRRASRLVHLPADVLGRIATVLDAIALQSPAQAAVLRSRRMDSIAGLSDRNRYLQLTAELPVAPGVRQHSIVARQYARGALRDASDGAVPYASAHLDDTASELVIASGHSVQNTPEAIAEIRRILREALAPDQGDL
jgi:pimeloyl-ACP methyl ester carboxylesterase